MPNTREKLIRFLTEVEDMSFVKKADHLIANGVTVQEWISVKDRLPVEDVKVLAVVKEDGYDRFAFAVCSQGKWWDCLYNGFHNVTHWMYLPEPPKGE